MASSTDDAEKKKFQKDGLLEESHHLLLGKTYLIPRIWYKSSSEFNSIWFPFPESVRFVEGSIEEDVNDNYFHMKLSGLTQGGGRAHTFVTCVGKFGKQAASKNKENSLESRVMANIRVLTEDNKKLPEENARQ